MSIFSKISNVLNNVLLHEFRNKIHLPLMVSIEKDKIWDSFSSSFDDPDFKQYNNCNCCRHFIQTYGGMVIISGDATSVITIWALVLDNMTEDMRHMEDYDAYVIALKSLDEYVSSLSQYRLFDFTQKFEPVKSNNKILTSGNVITFNHFFFQKEVGSSFYSRDVSTSGNYYQSILNYLNKFDLPIAQMLLKKIEDNGIVRGDTAKIGLANDIALYQQFSAATDKVIFLWDVVSRAYGSKKILASCSGSAISKMMENMVKGDSFDVSYAKYHAMVDPLSYRRSVTETSVRQNNLAKKALDDLGAVDSLRRRFASPEDLNPSDCIYLNRSSVSADSGDLFESLNSEKAVPPSKLVGLPKIPLAAFLSKSYSEVSVHFGGDISSHLFSLIAPSHEEDKNILSWGNKFSWAYSGGATSSITERVKAQGGNIGGVMRASLSWTGKCDLDISLIEDTGKSETSIYYENKSSSNTTAVLDVDANACSSSMMAYPVENICWSSDLGDIHPGEYEIFVNNYQTRSPLNNGFVVEFYFCGELKTFIHRSALTNSSKISVIKYRITEEKKLVILSSIDEATSTEGPAAITRWGMSLNRFYAVSAISWSPNHWGDNSSGTKHLFLYMPDAVCDVNPRSFFTEFLSSSLHPYRKVLEQIANKATVESSKTQLNGIGFLTTDRSSFIAKVKEDGNYNTYEVEI